MDFWTFWSQHPFLAWCALWLLWGAVCIVLTVLNLAGRVIRFGMVATRGWPPQHLDADGDWKPKPDDTEDDTAPSNPSITAEMGGQNPKSDNWREKVDEIANNLGETINAGCDQDAVNRINGYIDELFALARRTDG